MDAVLPVNTQSVNSIVSDPPLMAPPRHWPEQDIELFEKVQPVTVRTVDAPPPIEMAPP